MNGTASEFANECREDYRHYRENAGRQCVMV